MQLWLWIALPAALGLLALSLAELFAHERAMRQLVEERAQDQAQAVAAHLDVQIARLQERLIDFAHISQPDLSPPSSIFAGGMARYDAQGQTTGIFAASWAADPELAPLIRRTRTATAEGPPATYTLDAPTALLVVAVAGHDGTVWAGAQPVETLFQTAVDHILPLEDAAQIVLLSDSAPIAQAGATGVSEPAIRGEAGVAATGWRVQTNQPWGAMLSPLLRIGGTVGAVAVIAAVISGLAAYFGLHYVVRPLRHLNSAAVKAGWGDATSLQKPVGGVAEIDDLRLALIRMTEQVRRYQQQLRSYLDAMTLGQEEERRRLARELHDETVQTLIALNQQIELAEREVCKAPSRAAERLQALRPLVTNAIDGLRRQIHALRPLYLEDLGFVPALETLVRQTSRMAGIVGDFEVTGAPCRAVSPSLEISAFRIAQAALNNTAVHAHATWVHVELCCQKDGLALRIEDDGIGFDVPAHPFLLDRQGHFGLLGMHERTQAHGGRLKLHSEPGRGTTIEVWLPYRAALPTEDAQPMPEV